MNKDSGGGFFAGLIIGAIVGLAVGYLYAPQPGAETRRMVKEKFGTAKESAARAAGRIKERMKQRMAAQDEE